MIHRGPDKWYQSSESSAQFFLPSGFSSLAIRPWRDHPSPSPPPPPLLHPVVLGLRPGLRAPGSTPSSTQPWVASSPSPELDSRRIFITTTASVSKMQPAPVPLLEPFDTFHTSTSRMQSDDSPVAIPDHTSLLLLQESMVDMVNAIQRHNTGLYLGRSPSSSPTRKKDVAVLSHSRLDSAPEVFGNTPTSHPGADESITTAQARVVQAETTINKDMPRAVLDLKRRLDEQQARDRTSFETLQGELAKLTSMAAQLTISIGKHTASATPGSSPLGIIGTASVAPKVFDTMPTPSSGYENFAGHSDQSSAVHGGGTNPKEQNLDELPQAYGLHNLICRTVVRADGSEHSYYALPGNYTLEQDMPEPLLSNKFVGVSDSNPEQQPCEEEQQECEQPLKCRSKKIETEHSSACVSIISEVLELQPQDDGKSRNCPALKTSDPYVTRSSQFSIVCSVTEMRLLWDPGDTTSYALFTTADSATNLQCTNVYKPAVVQILAVQFGVRRVLIFKSAVMHCDALGLARTKVTGSALFVLVVPGSAGTACPSPSFENMAKLLWDPGILHYMAPNGCNSALQDNSFILQMAAHLSESHGKYF